MSRHLTLAERIASAEKDVLLEELADQSSWSLFIVQQAVFTILRQLGTASANDIRDLLPELGHGFLGAAINGMRLAGLTQPTGRSVPSTLESTHGHRIVEWELTTRGKEIAAQRAAARMEPAA